MGYAEPSSMRFIFLKVSTERMMKTTITINVGLDVSERDGYVFLKIAPNVVLELKNIVTL
jgi:hypothetical protein